MCLRMRRMRRLKMFFNSLLELYPDGRNADQLRRELAELR